MGFYVPRFSWFNYKAKPIKKEEVDPNIVICESIADFNMWIDG